MQNFSFYNPVQIEFGKDKENHIGEYIAKFGVKKVLLMYGSERIKKDGLFDKVVASLAKNGVEFVQCGGVVSNPVLSKVYEAINLAKSSNVDGVLAVGGGSVLDSSKTIAAGARYDGDVWDFFIGKASPKDALPLFDIITLAATGSEMNDGAVVTNEQTKQKYAFSSPLVFPKVSVINPELMKSISKDYLVYSASDIIAHSIEGYFTASSHPELISKYIEANITTIIKTTEILLKNPDDYEARAEFAWAATNALNGTTYVGVENFSYPNHMIEHSISALYNVAHGAGLSVVMPAWMQWYKSKNEARFSRFAKEIFGKNSADEGIKALKDWFEKIGTPTKLRDFNLNKSSIDEITKVALEHAKAFGLADIYTKEVLEEILNLAY
ncbi:family III metal-dependent polyol dehydrogenase [Campylobacter iguaniorum]|uniref:Family III metal-dependent polyol dehydrogenase n=1 Tax=Campylobacter iguaniorum TaxID=1244531 RepID=A0A076FAX0_9BACT|nr:iron-containing alcohol dehydrogenase [Campylobacter iguaniorum]AII15146.1 family III metal-dependent polyol dehydrogenase [Campylobacter iguaniorum]ALV25013.1 family III metal-dependent polyol dehydrogenase [Campylobacter iguaniorum]